jgi:type IV secretory pathway VirB10-like protein
MDAPTGLDLNPRPPQTVRLGKRAGLCFLIALGLVLAMLVYGIYFRRANQGRQIWRDEQDRVGPATAAARAVEASAADVPNLAAVPNRAPTRDPAPAAAPPLQNGSPAPVAQPRQPTAAELRLAALYEREQQAIAAPTGVRASETGFNDPAISAPGEAPDAASLAALAQALAGSRATAPAGAASVSASGGYDAQNMQAGKEDFLARHRAEVADDYLKSTRTASLSRYEVKAGWEIPAIMEQGINSDLPGELKALIAQSVYDTATGRYLLIPQGARLVGTYDSRVAYGQNGVQVVWDRIIFPDGSSINLAGMPGQDAHGYSGLRQSVDNHYKRVVGFAALTSLFSAGFALSQSRSGSILQYPSVGETVGGAVGTEVTQLGTEITRRNLNVQPTIKIPAGYRFNVRVNRDILFEGPYQPATPADGHAAQQ